MGKGSIEADGRILTAVTQVASLTAPAPSLSARDRLCSLLGYRLYRSLVAGLAGF